MSVLSQKGFRRPKKHLAKINKYSQIIGLGQLGLRVFVMSGAIC